MVGSAHPTCSVAATLPAAQVRGLNIMVSLRLVGIRLITNLALGPNGDVIGFDFLLIQHGVIQARP